MRIAVVGSGYVGLVTGACLAETGNHVTCVDKDQEKIARLHEGTVPIHEPGLEALIQANRDAGRLEFATGFDAVRDAVVVFIAVGTPPLPDGGADLSAVDEVAARIGSVLNGPKVIVNKSTVPVGTAARVSRIVGETARHPFAIVSNPEFLKEGAAVEDFMKPDRVVVGADDPDAIAVMRQIYAPFMRRGDRLLVMSVESAEMTKYASNAMLATRISFMNEIAALCERVGANVEEVRRGMAADTRIGGHFLFPGVGFGGSCFPKDLAALEHMGREHEVGMRILHSVSAVNRDQKSRMVEKVRAHFGGDLTGKTFAIWGLSFKPGTDDMREAPSVEIVRGLRAAGARVRASDPVALPSARALFENDVELSEDPYAILDGAHGLILVTEWLGFRSPDFDLIRARLADRVLFDGRNIWNRRFVEDAGFSYYGIGV
ncbi:MAG: UDP-glucose/GDP-mannose dehydrogenase family protein [Planctomycetota bacterium]|nr:UDP-glucose/GDP-mannose dehydrogenase family protein [Planctomycetota bacterium]